MKELVQFLACICFCVLWMPQVQAQEGSFASGGEASGSGGTLSYSAGQVFWSTHTGTGETLAEGVQQPFEISEQIPGGIKLLTALDINVYPNPASTSATLQVGTADFDNLSVQLCDLQGRIILEKKLVGEKTEIALAGLSPSAYILNILKDGMNIRVINIVKY